MPEKTDQPWCNVELRPAGSPHISAQPDGTYWIEWAEPSIAVMVTLADLRELVAAAMVAQATRGAG